MNQPKTLIDVKPIHEPMPKDAGNFEDASTVISIKLVDSPSFMQLTGYLPEFVLGIWQDRNTDLREFTEIERMWIVNEVMHNRTFLPTAAETIGCTWFLDGISVQDVTHLIRYRRGSYSAQCTGDRYMTNETFAIPSIINQTDLRDDYIEAMKKCQEVYNKLVYSGISPLDARYVMPMGKTTFYHARYSISDSLALIRQRIDRNIQPMSDNVIAYRMYQELLKHYPNMYDAVDIDAPPKWYFATMNTAFCSNLYQPEDMHNQEYSAENYVYEKRPWPDAFKKVYNECKTAQVQAKEKWLSILDGQGYSEQEFKDISKFERFVSREVLAYAK